MGFLISLTGVVHFSGRHQLIIGLNRYFRGLFTSWNDSINTCQVSTMNIVAAQVILNFLAYSIC